ncbi:MAG: IS66 family insertion sequence element accessory protein TnpB [Planctomycetota bacterium]|jgi:transposase|nr:IS66 family insertion sequence element accessory protein TnpB [Planctomycetota bacterium]
MIGLGVESVQIYAGAMDMRKGMDSLAAVVAAELGRDPGCGEAFVFVGKRRDRLKVLIWKRGGYWLCNHRLERGRFRIPELRRSDGTVCAVMLSLLEWQMLLEGVVVEKSRRLPRFHDKTTGDLLQTPI